MIDDGSSKFSKVHFVVQKNFTARGLVTGRSY